MTGENLQLLLCWSNAMHCPEVWSVLQHSQRGKQPITLTPCREVALDKYVVKGERRVLLARGEKGKY
jgi:hypothetical protein